MERRQLVALGAVLLGLVLAAVAKAVSAVLLAVVATVLLVGGGLAFWLLAREEAGRGGGRLSPLWAGRPRRGGAVGGLAPLTAYAAELNGVLSHCRALSARRDVSPGSAEAARAARETLARLVASPRYGPAVAAGLVDESAVEEASALLGALD